ncbi:MAG: 1,4-dihydroxy-2-naphthoate polyprenyltransferase [Proteobacteria bacterium]|nr:MAG: 1,4-dihydroxy-2-naphthoate polyprenyltransferase [Pseudomonadota bacterium]
MNLRSGTRLADTGRRGLRLGLWWMAIRPRTLSLSAIPVVAGSALAWHEGAGIAWLPLIVALLCALLIQAGTNLFNDVGDALRGNDGPTRLGPARVTASGLATPGQVRRAALATFLAALLGGIYLVVVGGWPILAIGLASLAAGWAYSGGPRPLSYTAWGEVFVMLFFGLVAVAGSHYLQSGTFTGSALWLGLALGCHAAAVLLVNNVRDLEADRRAGRRTLASVLGTGPARTLYAVLMLAPFPLLARQLGVSGVGAAWLALPACLWLALRFRHQPPGAQMNLHLARTAQAQLLLGALLSIALLW